VQRYLVFLLVKLLPSFQITCKKPNLTVEHFNKVYRIVIKKVNNIVTKPIAVDEGCQVVGVRGTRLTLIKRDGRSRAVENNRKDVVGSPPG
jgi:hypothetical protein